MYTKLSSAVSLEKVAVVQPLLSKILDLDRSSTLESQIAIDIQTFLTFTCPNVDAIFDNIGHHYWLSRMNHTGIW